MVETPFLVNTAERSSTRQRQLQQAMRLSQGSSALKPKPFDISKFFNSGAQKGRLLTNGDLLRNKPAAGAVAFADSCMALDVTKRVKRLSIEAKTSMHGVLTAYVMTIRDERQQVLSMYTRTFICKHICTYSYVIFT